VVTPYVIKYRDINPTSLLASVELLRNFGTVKVLSSPKLTVLNNQTATLKVSQDFVYFNVKQDVAAGKLLLGVLSPHLLSPLLRRPSRCRLVSS
jgi:Flp pilus assembly secretin CpaC